MLATICEKHNRCLTDVLNQKQKKETRYLSKRCRYRTDCDHTVISKFGQTFQFPDISLAKSLFLYRSLPFWYSSNHGIILDDYIIFVLGSRLLTIFRQTIFSRIIFITGNSLTAKIWVELYDVTECMLLQ